MNSNTTKQLMDGWIEYNYLTDSDIEHIYSSAESYQYEAGRVQNENLNDVEQYRKSRIKWIQLGDELSNKLSDLVVRINDNMWGFNINSLPKKFQFTEYDGNGSHYQYHADIGDGELSKRKISMVCGITKETNYVGGEFNLFGEPSNFKLEFKSVLLFPSFLIHKVYPVTQGTRYSLVNWVEGEPFK